MVNKTSIENVMYINITGLCFNGITFKLILPKEEISSTKSHRNGNVGYKYIDPIKTHVIIFNKTSSFVLADSFVLETIMYDWRKIYINRK